MTFAIVAGIVVPGADGGALGWFMFRGRVTGVYVAIITLAMLVVVNLLIIDQQQYTGGFNGITDLAQLTSSASPSTPTTATTYLSGRALSAGVVLLFALALTRSKSA